MACSVAGDQPTDGDASLRSGSCVASNETEASIGVVEWRVSFASGDYRVEAIDAAGGVVGEVQGHAELDGTFTARDDGDHALRTALATDLSREIEEPDLDCIGTDAMPLRLAVMLADTGLTADDVEAAAELTSTSDPAAGPCQDACYQQWYREIEHCADTGLAAPLCLANAENMKNNCLNACPPPPPPAPGLPSCNGGCPVSMVCGPNNTCQLPPPLPSGGGPNEGPISGGSIGSGGGGGCNDDWDCPLPHHCSGSWCS